MRYIVKLRNERNQLRYRDVEATCAAQASEAVLRENPNWWLVKVWPITETEAQYIFDGALPAEWRG